MKPADQSDLYSSSSSVCTNVCGNELMPTSLRGAKGLLIHGQNQSDHFLQLSVYYQLPFDLCQSGCRSGPDAMLAYSTLSRAVG